VPLVMISAPAIVYPRLRPGLRASLALLFGYFGVLAGTEAASYGSQEVLPRRGARPSPPIAGLVGG